MEAKIQWIHSKRRHYVHQSNRCMMHCRTNVPIVHSANRNIQLKIEKEDIFRKQSKKGSIREIDIKDGL